MNNQAITSSLDITNWLCQKADSQGIILGENKIQHLLFLAQIHFALKSGQFLMPSLFVCGRTGFYEPTIRTILSFGLPLMEKPRFSAEINDFLELIWHKYGLQEDSQLNRFVISLECWKHFYRPEEETIVNPMHFTDSFAGSIQGSLEKNESKKSKILISQNGPVKVSAWNPRKLGSSNK